ncbi:hypothetical protein FB451DRAFT_1568091 [Mycena latifolia]|nr:hypothetical protein FB451DRAFT_1568091 [Mycena latifolia]
MGGAIFGWPSVVCAVQQLIEQQVLQGAQRAAPAHPSRSRARSGRRRGVMRARGPSPVHSYPVCLWCLFILYIVWLLIIHFVPSFHAHHLPRTALPISLPELSPYVPPSTEPSGNRPSLPLCPSRLHNASQNLDFSPRIFSSLRGLTSRSFRFVADTAPSSLDGSVLLLHVPTIVRRWRRAAPDPDSRPLSAMSSAPFAPLCEHIYTYLQTNYAHYNNTPNPNPNPTLARDGAAV